MARQNIRLGRRGLVTGLVAALLVLSACQPTDIGLEGPSFGGAVGSPSGSKPESKVWFNDGIWWADMWDTSTSDYYIHRFDVAARRWVRTSTQLDDRSNSRSDTLWDGTNLFVASHAFAEGSSSTPTGQPAELRRFSYQPSTDTYTLDPGFPVQINDARTETLVIDRDSLGRIWATWMQDQKIMVTVSSDDQLSFGTPFELPATGTSVSSDDIASVVAYAGNRIGILWSNQSDEKMYFSSRSDSSSIGSWSATEVAYSGPNSADDHINLKNVSDLNGRILAAVKTSQSGSSPLVHLLDRDPATGTWSSRVFGLGSDSHTRPIVVIDRGQQRVHMFATSGQSGGSIYEKTAPLSNITFPTGKGTAVLTDLDSADINNATSTKQPVDSSTGLLVLATNDSTRQYWTHYDRLGGTPPASQPAASFTATPTTGPTPLDVAFTDTSSGSPTSRQWNFGDQTSSALANPTHRYTTPGTYSVTLTVTNAAGSSTVTRSDLVTAQPAGPGPVTFTASADALVKSTSPDANYGNATTLRTRAGSTAYNTYVRFNPSGLSGPPSSAVLRLYVTDPSRDQIAVRPTATTWIENTITWQNAPAGVGDGLTPLSAGTTNGWVEVDVTAAVAGNGSVSLQLAGSSTDSAIFTSRETATAPQLVITP